MKNGMLIMLGVLLSLIAQAQDGPKPVGKDTLNRKQVPMVDDGKYCGIVDHNVIKVEHNGQALTQDVKLPNGTHIGMDGMVILKDGSREVLREGDCIDKSGLLTKKPKAN